LRATATPEQECARMAAILDEAAERGTDELGLEGCLVQ
jgi:hypothetical protein